MVYKSTEKMWLESGINHMWQDSLQIQRSDISHLSLPILRSQVVAALHLAPWPSLHHSPCRTGTDEPKQTAETSLKRPVMAVMTQLIQGLIQTISLSKIRKLTGTSDHFHDTYGGIYAHKLRLSILVKSFTLDGWCFERFREWFLKCAVVDVVYVFCIGLNKL